MIFKRSNRKPREDRPKDGEAVVTMADMENIARSIFDQADRKAGIKTDRSRAAVKHS